MIDNKVEVSISSILAVSHAARRTSSTFLVKLSWSKVNEEASGTCSINKSCGLDIGLFHFVDLGDEGRRRTTR
jgi:hypothetical protein